jgi:hypothetical protein
MRHIRLCVSFLLLFTFGVTAVAQQPAPNAANAIVPPLVKFSGVLSDGNGKPLASTVGLTFSLYKDEQGGSPLWLETQNVQSDQTGHYSVLLGSTTSQGLPGDLFISGEARWVGVQPQGRPEQPRVLLPSVAYALKAQDAQTIGGLPPSAFVLAAPTGNAATGSNDHAASSASPPSSSGVTTTGGTVNTLPLWTTATNIQSSAITQTGSGKTAKIGINNSKPASALDVKGGSTIRGLFSLPATGTATSAAGFDSQPMDLAASAFNSGTSTAVPQTFQWQAEPVGNDTSNASGSLNLLFGQGTSKPTETGLNIASNGQITFVPTQTFPGTGTITGVNTTSGSGLTGGGTSGALNLSLTNGCSGGQVLQWNGSAWVCASAGNGTITGVTAGTDLTGGGNSGTVTLNLDTTKVPQLNTANTFTGNQTVSGNLSATGAVTGNSFQIGSNLFAFGTYANQDAFLGFAGNTTSTGTYNTGVGYTALTNNTTGGQNTAVGATALALNTMGYANTAIGDGALANDAGDGTLNGSDNTAVGVYALLGNTVGYYNAALGGSALQANTTGAGNTASGTGALNLNTTGTYNTATGYAAGTTVDFSKVIGSGDTFLGMLSAVGTGALNNSTAIGANAEVTASNALVLGSINGVNNATASTNVGIGITAPTYLLHIGNAGGANYSNFLRVEGPTQQNTGGMAASFGGYGDFGIDAVGVQEGRFAVMENGIVTIGCNGATCDFLPTNILTIGQGLGSALADGWATYSSRRWKTNIHQLQGALSKVQQLRGVSYDLKKSGKHEIGVIAEEVGKVVPEVVSYEDGKDARGVDYSRLTALLIEAIKEQQREIASERAQISKLRYKLAQLDGTVSGMKQAKSASARTTDGRTVAAKAPF